MIEELFKSGTLELPLIPMTGPQTELLWSDCLVNRILVLAAILVFLLSFSEFTRIFPKLTECVARVNYCLQMERNLGEKKSRDLLAFLSVLPFCIMADRYELYRCRFLENLDPQWGVAACAVVVLAWLFLHILLWAIVQTVPSVRSRKEYVSAAHHIIYIFFPVLVVIMAVSIGGMYVFSVTDEVISAVLRWEVIVVYLFSVLRFVRFLLSHCTAFSTILYLCILELIPASILVLGEVV